MAATVLDSHALLAYFRDDVGADKVENLLTKAATSNRPLHATEVSYAEVKSIILRKDGPTAWQSVASVVKGLPIEFHPPSRITAEIAADLKARHNISLSGAFAGALAREKRADLATGDSQLKVIEKEIKIYWLG